MFVEEGELLVPENHALDATTDPTLTPEAVRGFGRVIAIDHRDRNFMMQAPQLSLDASAKRRQHWLTGKVLDQGATSMCVAYSGQQFLTANPVRNKPWADVAALYEECQRNDEWPGEDYDGTSVRALFKVLHRAGFIQSYSWAFDVKTVISFVLNVGPVVFGTNWYERMFQTDCFGFVRVGGAIAGGHAYLIKGVDLDRCCPDGTRGALRLINSWGKEWGDQSAKSTGGHAWLSFRDADRLIKEWGEACTAIEKKPTVDKAAIATL